MSASNARYRGVFPVVPTTFTDDGELDLASQLRCVDFMIDAGSNGLAILANFSEQFVLSDDERETLTGAILDHVAGRVSASRCWRCDAASLSRSPSSIAFTVRAASSAASVPLCSAA